ARPGDREPRVRGRPRPGRLPRERQGDPRPYNDRGSLGRGAGPVATGVRGCGRGGEPHLSSEGAPQSSRTDPQDRPPVVVSLRFGAKSARSRKISEEKAKIL